MSQPLVNFADLGPPVTNTALSDALAAFAAVTSDTTIGAAGGGGGAVKRGPGAVVVVLAKGLWVAACRSIPTMQL